LCKQTANLHWSSRGLAVRTIFVSTVTYRGRPIPCPEIARCIVRGVGERVNQSRHAVGISDSHRLQKRQNRNRAQLRPLSHRTEPHAEPEPVWRSALASKSKPPTHHRPGRFP
jgi:hypothetical protein